MESNQRMISALEFVALAGGITYWIANRLLHTTNLKIAIKRRQKESHTFKEQLRSRLQSATEEVKERRRMIAVLKFEELRAQLQQGTISAKEVLEAYQWKALEADDMTNCVCLFVPKATEWAEELDRTYKENKPPLFGIPISVKESITMQGFDSTIGYAQNLFKPSPKNAALIESIRRLGAIPFVQTNVPQGLFWFGCSNPIYGTTKNPRDSEKTSGGSSGGEAALLASGGSILGLGGDVGGSIRIPAHFCGVVGLKPSSTRLSQLGSIGSVPGRPMLPACLGPMAREVDAVVAFMRHVTGDESMYESDPYVIRFPWRDEIYKGEDKRRLNIGFFDFDGVFEAAPACRRAVDVARNILEAKGHALVPYQPPNARDLVKLYLGVAFGDGGDYLYRTAQADLIDPYYAPMVRLYGYSHWASVFLPRRLLGCLVRGFDPTLSMCLLAPPRTIRELRSIHEKAEKAKRDYVRNWQEHKLDAVICPAFGSVALPHDGPAGVPIAATYTTVINLLDFVAGVVPVTKVEQRDEDALENEQRRDLFGRRLVKFCGSGTIGLPVGVQVITMPNTEERCLRLMKEIEDGRDEEAYSMIF